MISATSELMVVWLNDFQGVFAAVKLFCVARVQPLLNVELKGLLKFIINKATLDFKIKTPRPIYSQQF